MKTELIKQTIVLTKTEYDYLESVKSIMGYTDEDIKKHFINSLLPE